MAIDDLFRALQEALESGMEVTITLKKPPVAPKASPDKKYRVECPHCPWSNSYTRKDNAERQLRGHSKKCSGKKMRGNEFPQWLLDQNKGEK